MRRAVFLAAALLWLLPEPGWACSGCGCRGGPGYRGPNGQCVSWATIGRVCGSPPEKVCAPEGPNAPAENAAAEQVAARTKRGLFSPGQKVP